MKSAIIPRATVLCLAMYSFNNRASADIITRSASYTDSTHRVEVDVLVNGTQAEQLYNTLNVKPQANGAMLEKVLQSDPSFLRISCQQRPAGESQTECNVRMAGKANLKKGGESDGPLPEFTEESVWFLVNSYDGLLQVELFGLENWKIGPVVRRMATLLSNESTYLNLQGNESNRNFMTLKSTHGDNFQDSRWSFGFSIAVTQWERNRNQ